MKKKNVPFISGLLTFLLFFNLVNPMLMAAETSAEGQSVRSSVYEPSIRESVYDELFNEFIAKNKDIFVIDESNFETFIKNSEESIVLGDLTEFAISSTVVDFFLGRKIEIESDNISFEFTLLNDGHYIYSGIHINVDTSTNSYLSEIGYRHDMIHTPITIELNVFNDWDGWGDSISIESGKLTINLDKTALNEDFIGVYSGVRYGEADYYYGGFVWEDEYDVNDGKLVIDNIYLDNDSIVTYEIANIYDYIGYSVYLDNDIFEKYYKSTDQTAQFIERGVGIRVEDFSQTLRNNMQNYLFELTTSSNNNEFKADLSYSANDLIDQLDLGRDILGYFMLHGSEYRDLENSYLDYVANLYAHSDNPSSSSFESRQAIEFSDALLSFKFNTSNEISEGNQLVLAFLTEEEYLDDGTPEYFYFSRIDIENGFAEAYIHGNGRYYIAQVNPNEVEIQPAIKSLDNVIQETVTKDHIEKLVVKGEDFEIESSDNNLNVKLPPKVLEQLKSFNFDVNQVDVETLPTFENAKTLSTFYDFSILVGNEYFDGKFDEPVRLTFIIDPAKVNNPDNLHLVYVNDDGEITYYDIAGYNDKTGEVLADVTHFSVYGIAEVEITDESEEPNVPTDPTEPVDPLDPTEPTDPTDPEAPVVPSDPTDPAGPSEPVEPSEPTEESETPSDSTTPSESDKDAEKVVESTEETVDGEKLPATATNTLNFMIFGLMLLAVGLFMVIFKRRQA